MRSIPQKYAGGGYTLIASDAGKHIIVTGTTTIPNHTFTTGDAVTLINEHSSGIQITASVGTLYNSADGSTGNRTLGVRGMATILFRNSSMAYISGAGLT